MVLDLIVDSQIRIWVFLPIIFITFLMGIIRHYVSILFVVPKKIELCQIRDNQILKRARLLRENSGFIPEAGYLMRKQAFNKEDDGYLTQKKQWQAPNIFTNTAMVSDMSKDNLTNIVPMIFIGGWINWMFSGFITTKVPFMLTLRFQSMLQRGIELPQLDASWVSSASWYFLNVFGLRSIYALLLGEAFEKGQSEEFGVNQINPNDMKSVFRAEWEALQIAEHCSRIVSVEDVTPRVE